MPFWMWQNFLLFLIFFFHCYFHFNIFSWSLFNLLISCIIVHEHLKFPIFFIKILKCSVHWLIQILFNCLVMISFCWFSFVLIILFFTSECTLVYFWMTSYLGTSTNVKIIESTSTVQILTARRTRLQHHYSVIKQRYCRTIDLHHITIFTCLLTKQISQCE